MTAPVTRARAVGNPASRSRVQSHVHHEPAAGRFGLDFVAAVLGLGVFGLLLHVLSALYGPYSPAVVWLIEIVDLAVLFVAIGVIYEQWKQRGAAQSALADMRERYARFRQGAGDYTSVLVDSTGRIRSWNPDARGLLGYGPEAVTGLPLESLLADGDTTTSVPALLSMASEQGHADVETRLRHLDGRLLPAHVGVGALHDESGNVREFLVVIRDRTQAVQAEQALLRSHQELRELAAALQSVREEEKRRLARELHDGLGQWLTALKMDVSWVMQQLPPSDAALVEKARAMNAMLDRIVAETRRIAADLRPLMLDDLGFAAAAEWLTGDFSRRSGIRCELDLDQAASEIAEPQATALFRMLQESLTNVARHSGATWVRVRLQRDEGRLTLSVQDNGRGFQPGDEAKRGSFGLRGLRERAALLEGQVRVEPAPEGGTLLEVRMPCVESATVQVAA